MTATRPPGFVTRTISASIRSASASSITVTDIDLKAVVRKRQLLGVAIAKLDPAFEALLPGQGLGLAQQIGVYVDAGDAVAPSRASRQPAREDAAAAADLEDRLPRPQLRLLDQSPHHLQITDCVTPSFQDRHGAKSRAAESESAIALTERRYQWLPLRGRQKQRQ